MRGPGCHLRELVSTGGTIVAGDTTFSEFSDLCPFSPVFRMPPLKVRQNGGPGLRLSGGELNMNGTDNGPRVGLLERHSLQDLPQGLHLRP